MKIDVSRAYDGQGAFKNGVHDARAGMHHQLYRFGRLNQALHHLGRFVGRVIPGLFEHRSSRVPARGTEYVPIDDEGGWHP